MLLRLVRGKMPWHAHRVTQAVLMVLGLCFFLLGLLLEIHAANASSSSRGGFLVLGIASGVGGLILLLETLIVLPRRLRNLPSQSAALLKDLLLAEEYDRCPLAEQEKYPDEP